MELIQFRKDERQKPVEGHPWHITQKYYVTQYRTRVLQTNEHCFEDLYYVTEEWTDWQDLPQ